MNLPPDNETIDQWISGNLPEAEAAALEKYFEEHPDELSGSASDFDQSLLHDIDDEASNVGIDDLVEMIKTSSGCSSYTAPSPDAWRDILEPSDDPVLIGTLGDYEVIGLIATGGMGIVFRARDPELDRSVALKVLSPELASNASARQRFLREARAAAKLEHENILPIHGVHEAGGVPYFAMRLARGGSLQDALDHGEKFDTQELEAIAIGVASALEVAHSAGIIHRDIKPANILFDKGAENIWVCDFGIAHSDADPSVANSDLVAGTPHYMSPEQAKGDELDGRTDLYSLGAVLKRCAVDPPEWFAQLIVQLLDKNRTRRPADAAAVVSAIKEQAAPPQPKPVAGIALAFAALACLAVIAFFFTRPDSAPQPNFVEIESSGQRFSTLREAIMIAPSGSTLLLSGELICETEIIAPLGHEFTLRPAGDATPSVVSTNPTKHALFLRGRASIQGINFERRVPSEPGATAILGAYRSEKIFIEDCKFTTNPNSGEKVDGMGFALTSGSAVLRDCQFDMPGTTAIYITDPSDSEAPSDSAIHLEDCAIVARVVVFQRSRNSLCPVNITAEHCILLCDELLVTRPQTRNPAPIGLTINNSLIDVSIDYTRSSDPERGVIQWAGKDNRFANDNYPEALETNAIVGPMFDRSKIASPIDPKSLREALVGNIEFDWKK